MIPIITEEKEHCEELEQTKTITEVNIKENKAENHRIHEQIQNLEEITTYVQRTIRDRQEKISEQKIEEYELKNLLTYVREKLVQTKKQKVMEFEKKT